MKTQLDLQHLKAGFSVIWCTVRLKWGGTEKSIEALQNDFMQAALSRGPGLSGRPPHEELDKHSMSRKKQFCNCSMTITASQASVPTLTDLSMSSSCFLLPFLSLQKVFPPAQVSDTVMGVTLNPALPQAGHALSPVRQILC